MISQPALDLDLHIRGIVASPARSCKFIAITTLLTVHSLLEVLRGVGQWMSFSLVQLVHDSSGAAFCGHLWTLTARIG